MNCREAEQQLFASPEGAGDGSQRAALATHLATCAACRQLSATLTAALGSLRDDARRVAVPDADRAWYDVRRAIRGAETAPRRRSWVGWIGIPAAAAVALAAALYLAPQSESGAALGNKVHVASAPTAHSPTAASDSTVIYVDDKSGWTFVLAADATPHQL